MPARGAQAAYEEDLDAVFDVAAVRAALEARLRSLESELHQARALAPLTSLTRSSAARGQACRGRPLHNLFNKLW